MNLPSDSKINEYNKFVFNEEESIKTSISSFDGVKKLSDDDFLKTLKAIYPYIDNTGNFIPDSSSNIDVVEKVDSLFCHFGINKDNNFFMNSKSSGEVTEDTFENKFKDDPDFLESFRFLKDHKLLYVVLKNIIKDINKPVKFEAELFPILTMLADETGDVTFFGTKYSREKLGEKGAFVIFKAQIFEEDKWKVAPSEIQKKLISDILDADSNLWKFYSNDVHMKVNQPIHFGTEIKELSNYLETESDFKKLKELMNSKTTPEKRRVNEILINLRVKFQQALNNIANNLISNLGISYAEGVVLRIKDINGDILEIKSVSDEYSNNKDKLLKHREQTETLFNKFKDDIKTKILHLKLTSDRSINQTFIDAISEDNEYETIIVKVINKLIDKNADFTDIKSKAKKLVKDTKHQFIQLKKDFKETEETFDVNSAKKTKDVFTVYNDKFENLFNILLGETDNDLQYVLNCFNAIYECKVKSLIVKPENPTPENIPTEKLKESTIITKIDDKAIRDNILKSFLKN